MKNDLINVCQPSPYPFSVDGCKTYEEFDHFNVKELKNYCQFKGMSKVYPLKKPQLMEIATKILCLYLKLVQVLPNLQNQYYYIQNCKHKRWL